MPRVRRPAHGAARRPGKGFRFRGRDGRHIPTPADQELQNLCGAAADDELEVVGTTEIAERLGVKVQTVSVWNLRCILPEASWTVTGRPAWRWGVVKARAAETGRLADHDEGEGNE